MSTLFILLYIVALIAALFGLIGIVSIANGLINNNHKGAKTGTFLTGIAVILVVTGLFFGGRKCFKVYMRNCHNKEMKCGKMGFDNCMMHGGNTMMWCDSSMNGDTCKMTSEKMVIMKNNKNCDPAKCDTSKCKHKCPHSK